jgi:3D (Asp-Asp-Asp) domain-containing protein
MNKIKVLLLILIVLIIIYLVPMFLDFMETQNDILKIGKAQQIFEITNKISVKEYKNTQNIPIPSDILAKMKAEQEEKARIEAEKAEKERLRQEQLRLEEEKRKQEEQKAKEIKIAKERKQETSRSSTPRTGDYIAFTATGYCPCKQCCGKTNGMTASGTKAQAGVTVAMPSRYAFGTKIEIKSMGTYTVQDRGGAIQGNKIDIFFNTHQEALKFGRRTVYLRVL